MSSNKITPTEQFEADGDDNDLPTVGRTVTAEEVG